MSSPPPKEDFTISRATTADIPDMVELWYSAFSPGILVLLPDTPSMRNIWFPANYAHFLSAPDVTVMVACDETKERRPVAYAVWRKHPGGNFNLDWKSRWPAPLVEELDEERLGPGFFDPMIRQHVVATGYRSHWFLEVLGTHKDFQKKGLGSKLVEWGCQEADKEGLECYLDASAMGKPLYEKHGFIVQDFKDPKAVSAPMKRPAKEKI